MKKSLLLLLSAGISLAAFAQDVKDIHVSGVPRCAFNEALDKMHISYPDLQNAYRSNAANTASLAKTTNVIYDIPVVFHILHAANQDAFNLDDSIINNQVAILNKAYRKQHADTGNVRAIFKPVAGDAEIQFHLATTDPKGNPTTGIVRTVTARKFFSDIDFTIDSMDRIKRTAQGGDDPWPTDRYLNIWIGNISNSKGQLSVLGYGLPPINPIPAGHWGTDSAGVVSELARYIDGVVLQPHAVGNNNALSAALGNTFMHGRSMVHEVGHYLGLPHVFGQNSGDSATADCGAIADDGFADTPPQSTFSYANGCPSATKNSCGAGTPGDLPDMWEDYMDYANDGCMAMFTNEQIALMRSVLANQRASIFYPVSVPAVQVRSTFQVYPNPAADKLSIQYLGTIKQVVITNFIGQQLMALYGAEANAKTYHIGQLPAGNYIVLVETDKGQLANKFTVVK